MATSGPTIDRTVQRTCPRSSHITLIYVNRSDPIIFGYVAQIYLSESYRPMPNQLFKMMSDTDNWYRIFWSVWQFKDDRSHQNDKAANHLYLGENDLKIEVQCDRNNSLCPMWRIMWQYTCRFTLDLRVWGNCWSKPIDLRFWSPRLRLRIDWTFDSDSSSIDWANRTDLLSADRLMIQLLSIDSERLRSSAQ